MGLKRKGKYTGSKEPNPMHLYFEELFDRKKDRDGYVRCFETGELMHESKYKRNSCIYSHCLPKKQFPRYAMKDWNILIVTPESHTKWESRKSLVPRMNEYYQKLLKAVELIESYALEPFNLTDEQMALLKELKIDKEDSLS